MSWKEIAALFVAHFTCWLVGHSPDWPTPAGAVWCKRCGEHIERGFRSGQGR